MKAKLENMIAKLENIKSQRFFLAADKTRYLRLHLPKF